MDSAKNQKMNQSKWDAVDDALLSQPTVNTFMLKIFAILFCKGSLAQKSLAFYDAIIGPSGIRTNRDTCSWKSQRTMMAFKYLIYFSEIFPKKYWKKFMEDDAGIKPISNSNLSTIRSINSPTST